MKKRSEDLKIVYVDIDELKPNEYNPRKWTNKMIESLKESVKRFGIVDPIIVNSYEERKNVVIGGHFRLEIAKQLGYKKVPVIYVYIDDLEKEKELCLRLNKNLGERDWEKLTNFELDFLKDVGFDVNELTFIKELDKLEDVDVEIMTGFEDATDVKSVDTSKVSFIKIGPILVKIEKELVNYFVEYIREKVKKEKTSETDVVRGLFLRLKEVIESER